MNSIQSRIENNFLLFLNQTKAYEKLKLFDCDITEATARLKKLHIQSMLGFKSQELKYSQARISDLYKINFENIAFMLIHNHHRVNAGGGCLIELVI